ncbi:MAG: RusA family crossover junction endodeoxyribonuclease [Pleurocapsa sp. SU_196_0]|nr:RusA family crossover junction endodeoxyribonuclease [Pleurocapsa sp. SU_196_0]
MTHAEKASSCWRDLLHRCNGDIDRALRGWKQTGLEADFGPAPCAVQLTTPRLEVASRSAQVAFDDAPLEVETHDIPGALQFVIPGVTLTANLIWRSVMMPRAKLDEITKPLYAQTAPWIISNLFRLVRENFRPSVIMTKEAEVWKARVVAQLQPLASRLPPARTYRVTLEFHGHYLTQQGNVLRRDLDNQTKLLMDAVAEGLGFNDSAVFELRQRKVHDLENPHTVVTLEVLDAIPQQDLFGGTS